MSHFKDEENEAKLNDLFKVTQQVSGSQDSNRRSLGIGHSSNHCGVLLLSSR